MLEAILNVVDTDPVTVEPHPASHESVTIETGAGYPIQINALGNAPLAFDIDICESDRTTHHELADNFTAFRRTLWRFVEAVRTGRSAIPSRETLTVVRTLIGTGCNRGGPASPHR